MEQTLRNLNALINRTELAILSAEITAEDFLQEGRLEHVHYMGGKLDVLRAQKASLCTLRSCLQSELCEVN